MIALLTFFIFLVSCALGARGQTSYDNDWVDPDYILAGGFTNNTGAAQQTIIAWAEELASQGPWCTFNSVLCCISADRYRHSRYEQNSDASEWRQA